MQIRAKENVDAKEEEVERETSREDNKKQAERNKRKTNAKAKDAL